jgi:NAD(P)-dependent dehydrogenase (short-subunit alcohol dehydrogenase family)
MSELRFDDRVAIVTGAGRGLGRAHAMLLAHRGAMVVVNDVGGSVNGAGSDTAPATETVEEILEAGGIAVPSCESVTTREGGAAIVEAAIDAFGRLDIVVNNAGILRDRSFHKASIEEHVDPVLDVHLRGAFNVSHAAWGHMRDQGYGRIVNTTSSAGLLGNFGQASYAAAKMGIVGLTRALAQEGASRNIRVNAIAPMAITRMSAALTSGDPDVLAADRVSPVVAYLAHEGCAVNGEVLSAAGGYVARVFIGFTPGISEGADLTPEVVRDQLDRVRDEDGYVVHDDPKAEARAVYPRLR